MFTLLQGSISSQNTAKIEPNQESHQLFIVVDVVEISAFRANKQVSGNWTPTPLKQYRTPRCRLLVPDFDKAP